MFLSQRSMQAEYFDSARPADEVADFFRSLGFFNRLFAFAQPFQRWLPSLMDEQACRSLSILDVGAGDGSLGTVLNQWARQRGWDWKVVNLDSCWLSLRLNSQGGCVAASALALPFRDCSFDAVIASQMAHHLNDAEAEQLLREAWRVTRRVLLLSDLHRSLPLYLTLWLLCHLRRHSPAFCADALLSVKRAWRRRELQTLATRAGLISPQVAVHFGARVILTSRKQGLARTIA